MSKYSSQLASSKLILSKGMIDLVIGKNQIFVVLLI